MTVSEAIAALMIHPPDMELCVTSRDYGVEPAMDIRYDETIRKLIIS